MPNKTFPTPWVFDEDERWIHRETSLEYGEIAMQFTRGGVPNDDILDAVLAMLNEAME